jgi:hypothetical protein
MGIVLCIMIKYGERQQRKWVERGECMTLVSNYTSLRQFLQKRDGRARIGIVWLRIGPAAGSCENGYEPSGSIKCGEFLD